MNPAREVTSVSNELGINKRQASAVLQSLLSGVVPSEGLESIVVGRRGEISQVLHELAAVQEGSAIAKFLIGDYGSGKTFLLSLVRQIAMQKKFVVTTVDFSPERRLYAQDGKALACYRSLMQNLSTRARPNGGALPSILQKWINEVQVAVAGETGQAGRPDQQFVNRVQQEIRRQVAQMEELSGGFDFAEVINSYYRGYVEDKEELQSAALRWLRGEYTTKTDAHRDLGVRAIIRDDNWFEYLKVVTAFARRIGYSGLVVCFDEAINLYKITQPQSREKNYDTILSIFNDCHQGRCEGLYCLFAGTPEFLLDERRGIASYQALASRLSLNVFETEEFRDYSQPVIRLPALRPEELFALLKKLRDIHGFYHQYQPPVSDDEIQAFLEGLLARPGARERITAREVIKRFLQGLSILQQNPGMDKEQVFQPLTAAENGDQDDLLARFAKDRA